MAILIFVFPYRLLEQGFEESVTKIILKCPNSRQSALLSATLSSGMFFNFIYLSLPLLSLFS